MSGTQRRLRLRWLEIGLFVASWIIVVGAAVISALAIEYGWTLAWRMIDQVTRGWL